MAKTVTAGAAEVGGVEAEMFRIPETLSDDVLEKMGALEPQKEFADVPVADTDTLTGAEGFIFGTPTRFANMCGQMKVPVDRTGQLWAKGALTGSRLRLHVLKHPARRAGDDDSHLLRAAHTPGHDPRRHPLQRETRDDRRRDNRREPPWRFDHRRAGRQA